MYHQIIFMVTVFSRWSQDIIKAIPGGVLVFGDFESKICFIWQFAILNLCNSETKHLVFFFSSNGNLCEINDRYFCIFLITLSFFGIFFFRIFSPLFNPFSPRFIISARWWLTILLNRCHYLKTVNEELEVLDLFSEHLLVLHDVLSHSLRGC